MCALASGAFAAPAPAADKDEDPAKSCRADGPQADTLLPIVEPIVHAYLGVHPKSTTSGVAIGIVTPTPGLPGEPMITLLSCGVTSLDGTEPITPDSVFEIGSESKLFTAIALARTVLAGDVDLDDSLQSYLPVGISAPSEACGDPTGRPITLRDLATHNSGLVKNPKNVTWSESNPLGHQDYDRDHLWNSFTHGYPALCDPMLFSPGEGYSYSNWGFALLGTVLADVYAPGGAVPALAAAFPSSARPHAAKP